MGFRAPEPLDPGNDKMPDQSLRQTVLDELKWDPSVNADEIGVIARDRIVTLTGQVDTYAQKWAAERAAERVAGIKSIIVELEIRDASSRARGDDEIAKRAAQSLAWDVGVPQDRLEVKVKDGWVTVSGHVDWYFQKHNAECAIQRLRGVMGITDLIMIEPVVEAHNISGRINTALRRTAFFNHDHVVITAEGGKVTLRGRVDNYHELCLAFNTAWSAPGVTAVSNLLTVD